MENVMLAREIRTLDERFDLDQNPVLLSGTQALVRLLLFQARLDRCNGLETAGFVSGYRGSPLGGLDREFWRAQKQLDDSHIVFEPGLNEDLAATAVWGSQQANIYPTAKYDGVFGLWYGKSPGVDRSGDVFRHGNLAGTSRHGGVVIAAGDDPAAKSSTTTNQSEFALVDAMIPVIVPATIGDILEFGLRAYALSRYSGMWTALKILVDHADASGTVDFDPDKMRFAEPEFDMPDEGVSIRWPDPAVGQEQRLHEVKLPAAAAFVRANSFDRVTHRASSPRIGIVAAGKAWVDTVEALSDLGIDDALADAIGLTVYKVGMSWPLEPEGIRRFAEGLDEVIVVEEKRSLVETQLRDQAYGWSRNRQPVIVGKADEKGAPLISALVDLDPRQVAIAIGTRIARMTGEQRIADRVHWHETRKDDLRAADRGIDRLPAFCSGCPHNTSTRVPEGSRSGAGIGCHGMIMLDASHTQTATITHMGGEGANWIGQSPFVEDKHVFQNLGDGTYAHSGSLAIRAAVAANRNITYKLLYNDAVAMTGGQPVEGQYKVADISRQLDAEGVKRIVIVSNEPEKYKKVSGLAPEATIRHRDELDAVQRELRETRGVTVLIYDQTCATELRRRRKRGLIEDPDSRVFINQRVCEGCGDCGVQSNCMSIVPVETEFGRKRAINQSSCNKDYSCVKGFCPSFVTVTGAEPRRMEVDASLIPTGDEIPAPSLSHEDGPQNILIAGIGGTGVVTISALLATAAHMDGRKVIAMDQTGLAQKYGAVLSHVRIDDESPARAARIPDSSADVIIGCDLLTSASREALRRLSAERSSAVLNTHREMPSGFRSDRDIDYPEDAARSAIGSCVSGDVQYVEATVLAERVFGNSIFTNPILMGFAWQRGWLPVSMDALMRAIELNGVAVENNRLAFRLGRAVANEPSIAVNLLAAAGEPGPRSLDERVRIRMESLEAYQDDAYAERFRQLVDRTRVAERALGVADERLTEAVAFNYFKLLAYKDEYEVARLYTDGEFRRDLEKSFGQGGKLKVWLSPPLFARVDPVSGRPKKYAFGGWIFPVFRMLAKFRKLRGTPLDIFGYTEERRLERRLISVYEAMIEKLLADLNAGSRESAIAYASVPENVRGFGVVKLPAAKRALEQMQEIISTDAQGAAGTAGAKAG